MLQYKNLISNEICRELFSGFIRRQVVTKCWRRESGAWVIKDAPFIDDWTEKDYELLVSSIRPIPEVSSGLLFWTTRSRRLSPSSQGRSVRESNTLTFQVSTSPLICGEKESGLSSFMQLLTGPGHREPKNSIFPPILLLKARHFIKKWDVSKRKNTQAGTSRPNRSTASLSIYCLIFKLTDPFRLPGLDRPAAMGHFRKDLILLEIDLESPVFVGRENVGFLQHFAIFLQEIRLSIQCQETGLHETCIR